MVVIGQKEDIEDELDIKRDKDNEGVKPREEERVKADSHDSIKEVV